MSDYIILDHQVLTWSLSISVYNHCCLSAEPGSPFFFLYSFSRRSGLL